THLIPGSSTSKCPVLTSMPTPKTSDWSIHVRRDEKRPGRRCRRFHRYLERQPRHSLAALPWLSRSGPGPPEILRGSCPVDVERRAAIRGGTRGVHQTGTHKPCAGSCRQRGHRSVASRRPPDGRGTYCSLGDWWTS